MVVDNADDIGIFSNVDTERQDTPRSGAERPQSISLAKYLPQSPNGSILITTRDENTAFRLTGSHRDILRVDIMEQTHGLALLQKKPEQRFEQEAAVELG
jgi:hypothetical protein